MRLATREILIVHTFESFGPVRYVIGFHLLRSIEKKIWSKMHQMASDLHSWFTQAVQPPNLEFIGRSCVRKFTAKYVLVGNIPFDYVAR